MILWHGTFCTSISWDEEKKKLEGYYEPKMNEWKKYFIRQAGWEKTKHGAGQDQSEKKERHQPVKYILFTSLKFYINAKIINKLSLLLLIHVKKVSKLVDFNVAEDCHCIHEGCICTMN